MTPLGTGSQKLLFLCTENCGQNEEVFEKYVHVNKGCLSKMITVSLLNPIWFSPSGQITSHAKYLFFSHPFQSCVYLLSTQGSPSSKSTWALGHTELEKWEMVAIFCVLTERTSWKKSYSVSYNVTLHTVRSISITSSPVKINSLFSRLLWPISYVLVVTNTRRGCC